MYPTADNARSRPSRARLQWTAGRLLFGAVLLVGCGGLGPVAPHEPITDPAQLYMRLTLDHGAINMSTAAPYNTLQLTATPRNARGEPMAGLPAPTFRSADTTRVRVTADGELQARRQTTGAGVRVIAELVADGNVRHADTAMVRVTTNPAPPVLTTFSIDPLPPATNEWTMLPTGSIYGQISLLGVGIDIRPSLPLRALDANGDPIAGLAIEYESLDPTIVRINPTTGLIFDPLKPGDVPIVVRTMAYGTAKTDTAVFTVTLPAVHGVVVRADADGAPAFQPSSVTIRPNGLVFWFNSLVEQSIDVTFDDPTNVAEVADVCVPDGGIVCGSGNIPAWTGEGGVLVATRGRQFAVPGTYTYRDTRTGATGRVVVAADATP